MADRLTVVENVSYYDVLLHRASDLEAVVEWASGNGMGVIAAAGRRLRVRATPSHARALGELVAVVEVDEWTPPPIVADHVARLVWGTSSR